MLIPLRAIFSAWGANVIWDGATKSIAASKMEMSQSFS
ncbi:hypothetical protein KHA80_12720 [Anaerobacillus sp. HL2]|nr:hypothetical protein KHA80_12720 [Anaerobacillus sp. HL2]